MPCPTNPSETAWRVHATKKTHPGGCQVDLNMTSRCVLKGALMIDPTTKLIAGMYAYTFDIYYSLIFFSSHSRIERTKHVLHNDAKGSKK